MRFPCDSQSVSEMGRRTELEGRLAAVWERGEEWVVEEPLETMRVELVRGGMAFGDCRLLASRAEMRLESGWLLDECL